MNDPLRSAARRALEKLGGEGGPDGAVQRLVLDVMVGERTEIVSFALRDGELVATSSGGDGPHLRAAMRWLAEGGSSEASPAVRMTDSAETMVQRVSWTPDEPEDELDPPKVRASLAEALEDVVTVIARAGAAATDSPSISESLEQLRRAAPLPTPVGLSRWLGRLKGALDAHDVGLTARLLHGAALLAQDLKRERPAPAAKRRVIGWMGASAELGGAIERISDRALVEVAREQLHSMERAAIERRYLVDLQSGEVFREERTRTGATPSVGPCPRLVTVGLAEVEDGPAPRRIRLMQYAVSLEIGADELERVGANAYRRFTALADRYRELVAAHPGQAEPFVVVAPARVVEASACYDDEGQPLPFARADDPAAVEALARVAPGTGARWIAGRLTDADGVLMLVPCAVVVPDGEHARHFRLR